MADASFWLTTDRLGLRRFARSDLDWLAAMYADADVTRFLGGTLDRAAVGQLLEGRILKYYDDHPGLGIWMTVERQSAAPIGFHNLNHIRGERFIQVGFVLAREAWGRGFASEMALALLRHGFVDLRLPQIVGIASPHNTASQRVLAKIGLQRNGERLLDAYASDGPQAWFERSAADWLAEAATLG